METACCWFLVLHLSYNSVTTVPAPYPTKVDCETAGQVWSDTKARPHAGHVCLHRPDGPAAAR